VEPRAGTRRNEEKTEELLPDISLGKVVQTEPLSRCQFGIRNGGIRNIKGPGGGVLLRLFSCEQVFPPLGWSSMCRESNKGEAGQIPLS